MKGDFYSGSRNEIALNLTLRAAPGYIVYQTGERNHIEVPEGEVTTQCGRDAVHAVRRWLTTSVRHGESRVGLVVALPLDHHAGQQLLSSLHPQLG